MFVALFAFLTLLSRGDSWGIASERRGAGTMISSLLFEDVVGVDGAFLDSSPSLVLGANDTLRLGLSVGELIAAAEALFSSRSL